MLVRSAGCATLVVLVAAGTIAVAVLAVVVAAVAAIHHTAAWAINRAAAGVDHYPFLQVVAPPVGCEIDEDEGGHHTKTT